MLKIAIIFIGAGTGGVLRHAVHTAVQRWAPSGFPLGTLVVNASGCLVAGVLAGALAGQAAMREEYRLLLFVGLLGGYTTFSAFGRETVELMQRGAWGMAGLNVLLSNVLGIGGLWLGWIIAGGRSSAGG